MVNQNVPPEARFSEHELREDCDSVPERIFRAPPTTSFLAKILRDTAQMLNHAADYLDRR